MPLDDLLAASLRVVGALFVALGVWIFTTPSAEPDDKFEDYVFDHVDAVRDLFDDARDRLMRDDVATIDERVFRHAEVIFGSKYYVYREYGHDERFSPLLTLATRHQH